MSIIRSGAARRRFVRVRRATGWLISTLAIPLAPTCWIASTALHASICGVGLSAWTFHESLGAFFVHQALVSLSPITALLLFAVGDELRSSR